MLENYPYCPTLYARVAEIKALGQLPAATKDRIFPLILVRPWPNAKHLSRTWDKISEAMGNRRFALDIDITRQNVVTDKPVNMEFRALLDSRAGFTNYYNAVRSIPEAIPVLRITGGEAVEFEAQSINIHAMDRGLVVRLQYGHITNPLALVDLVLARFADVSFFVDVGWSQDLIGREMWASSIVERISRDHPEIEVVISGSSFPPSFSNVAERGAIRVQERGLFDSLVRRHNAAALIYGDWGSTRPPSEEQIPMRNVPRIDLPTSSQWIAFRRNKELDNEDYTEIAQRVVADPEWPRELNIWGTYTIMWTANAEPGAIRGPAAAAAARINIHLHRQAFFGANTIITDGDEPYTDD